MDEIKLGKYRHYKGNLYEVFGLAKHSETEEEFNNLRIRKWG